MLWLLLIVEHAFYFWAMIMHWDRYLSFQFFIVCTLYKFQLSQKKVEVTKHVHNWRGSQYLISMEVISDQKLCRCSTFFVIKKKEYRTSRPVCYGHGTKLWRVNIHESLTLLKTDLFSTWDDPCAHTHIANLWLNIDVGGRRAASSASVQFVKVTLLFTFSNGSTLLYAQVNYGCISNNLLLLCYDDDKQWKSKAEQKVYKMSFSQLSEKRFFFEKVHFSGRRTLKVVCISLREIPAFLHNNHPD